MTQEERVLLTVAICEYLPYKPILINGKLNGGYPQRVFPGYLGLGKYLDSSYIDETRIFLIPMSSMTDEELKQYDNSHILDNCDELEMLQKNDMHFTQLPTSHAQDYLNSIHVDYRGLIPMGLAIEAPGDMYQTTQEK